MNHLIEPQKQIPILYDVDVAIAGAGVAGTFAAIAAARNGAETVLVDRFGSVGGNIGPGMIVNGGMISGQAHEKVGNECTVYPRLYGIGREFIDRYTAMGGGTMPGTRYNYAGDACIASYVAHQMLEESGVRLLLSAYVADPVLDGPCVRGLFVENKSGRQAIMARVVIDATGDADVARRSPTPVLYPKDVYAEVDGHAPTGMGSYCLVGGVDWARYEAYTAGLEIGEDDLAWAKETLGEYATNQQWPILPFLRAASEKGEYELCSHVDLDGNPVRITCGRFTPTAAAGVVEGRINVQRTEVLDTGNGRHISALEVGVHARAFETARFWKQYVPGFEDSCLLCVAPFLGARGGPSIDGEYVLTMDDCRAGRRFDDVMYLYGEFRALRYTCEQGEPKWADVPYRVMLPKQVDGLMVAGRCASGIPDTLLRNRMTAKVMGEACGIAAAMSVEQGIAPKRLDVKALQRTLLDAGFYLGDEARLAELGVG